MVKSKEPPKNNRKLTDYFVPRSSSIAPSSSQPHCSPVAGPSKLKPKKDTNTVKAPVVAPPKPQFSKSQKGTKHYAPPQEDQEVISISSDTSRAPSHISISSDSAMTHISISSDSTSGSVQIVDLLSPVRLPTSVLPPPPGVPITRSRTRASASPAPPPLQVKQQSPEVFLRPAAASTHSRSRSRSHSKPPSSKGGKRKNKFDDDYNVEVLDTVIEVPPFASHTPTPTLSAGTSCTTTTTSSSVTIPTRSPLMTKVNRISPPRDHTRPARDGPSPPKKPRLASQSPQRPPDPESFVIPSSQSDEMDTNLTWPLKNKTQDEVRVSVQKWREETDPSRTVLNPGNREALTRPLSPSQPDMLRDVSLTSCEMKQGPPIGINDELELSCGDFEFAVNGLSKTDEDADNYDSAPGQTAPDGSPYPTSFIDMGLPTPVSLERESNSLNNDMEVDEAGSVASGALARSETPPPAFRLPMSTATPRTLDAEAKTKQILDDIRARARAKAVEQATTSRKLVVISASDSDEEDVDIFSMVRASKSTARLNRKEPSLIAGSPLTDLDSPEPSHLNHRSALPQSPSPPSRRAVPQRARQAPMRIPIFASNATTTVLASSSAEKAKGKARANPLRSLLLEKERADKAGRGMSAVMQAEMSSLAEFDSDEEYFFSSPSRSNSHRDEQDYGNDGMDCKTRRSPKSLDTGSEVDEPIMAESDRERLLGSKEAKDVRRILDSDLNRKNNANTENAAELSSIRFWKNDRDSEQLDSPTNIPALPTSCTEQSFSLLSDAIERANSSKSRRSETEYQRHLRHVSRTMQCAMPSNASEASATGFTEWLFSLSLHEDDYLSQMATSVLLTSPAPILGSSAITSHLILSSISAFGADSETLSRLGWNTNIPSPVMWTQDRRQSRMQNLVRVLATAASLNGLLHCDVPVVVACLLGIGLDISTSDELRRSIASSVEDILASLRDDSVILASCLTVVSFGRTLRVQQRSALLEMIPGGCPQVRHMSRWIAFLFLVNMTELPMEVYSQLPPLGTLVTMLSPTSKSMFAITPSTNYPEFIHHAYILNGVLTDIDSFVLLEKSQVLHSRGVPLTPIEEVEDAIRSLQGKIDDVRAAHIERSRAKGVLHSLQSRLHYQRLAASELLRSNKRDLTSFFSNKGSKLDPTSPQ